MTARRRRGQVAALVLAVGVCATGYFGVAWWRSAADNAVMVRLANGKDVAVSVDEPDNRLAARGLLLISQRHVEDAQAIAERMAGADARAILLYALGNAHMRQALMIFSSAPMRQVAPMIQLAKSEYRQALHVDPENWDARYNFDIAADLVRDADPPPSSKGEEMARERAYFPDVPGAPNGLP